MASTIKTVATIDFDNSFASLPERLFARVSPQPVPAPKLFAWNVPLAKDLGLETIAADEERLAQMLGGNLLPDGAEPIALAYAGHQFGHFSPQLGDGRAVLLGEVLDGHGKRFDVQLKGSGRTPFSRGGDGKSSLGPVIREYLLSEAMHVLGVPTTRALAAVQTGEHVYREARLPGGILTRVASSHIRIGSFEYFAARGDVEALKALADFAIARHAPAIATSAHPYLEFLGHVIEVQAALVAHWMAIGFIHGVMNTDNTAVSGETLDYGPCAFMDEYDSAKVFSSIDRGGRYAFDQQPSIVHWNLTRLAECLLMLEDDQAAFEQQLGRVKPIVDTHFYGRMRLKLGLIARDAQEELSDNSLVSEWLAYLQSNALDYTLSFRQLAKQLTNDSATRFGDFEEKWLRRLKNQTQSNAAIRKSMDAVNPLFIPRNHQIERAIQTGIVGDFGVFESLQKVLAKPFEEQPDMAEYAIAPLPEERVARTFCGT